MSFKIPSAANHQRLQLSLFPLLLVTFWVLVILRLSFLWICAFLLLSCFSPRCRWLLPVCFLLLCTLYSGFAASPIRAIFAPLSYGHYLRMQNCFWCSAPTVLFLLTFCAFSFTLEQTCLQHAHETECPLGDSTDKVEIASAAWKGWGRWSSGFYFILFF